MNARAIAFSFLALFSVNAFAQSPEMEHGPRAGKVIGKGDVLAEVLRGPGTSFRVFFIDGSWTDIRAEGVTAKAALKPAGGKKEASMSCTPQGQGFQCDMPKDVSAAVGDLIVFTRETKEGQKLSFDYTVAPIPPTPTPWGM